MLSETPYKYHIGKKQFIPITKGKGITDIVGTLLPINSTGEDCYLHDLEHIYKIKLQASTNWSLYLPVKQTPCSILSH